MFTEFCSFLEDIYGGSHYLTKDTLGFPFLIIENGTDKFKINLFDKTRFGHYTLFHWNSGKFLDGKYGYHFQAKSRNISYLIFIAYQHLPTKEIGVRFSTDDYSRLMRDWRRSCIEQIV